MLNWLVDRLCKPGSTVWGNCFYAFLLYAKHGGHIIITRSAGHPVIPHVAWTDQLQPTIVQHLLPVKRHYGWSALIRAPFFRGRWVTQVIPKTLDREASDATLDNVK